MREILFRGKRIDNGEWVEGFYSQFHNRPTVNKPNSHQIFELIEDGVRFLNTSIGGYWHIVDPLTVGQYTGLTDKNGKKIFEGDILRCGNIKGVVKYSKKRAAFTFEWKRFTFHGGDFFKECGLADFGEFSGLEVIGNIHDNPELLEVSGDELS